MTRKQIFDELYDKYLYMKSKEHKQAIYTDMKPLFRQSRRYLLRFWRITVGALLCQSRSHVPQARASRLFLALLASNAPKLLLRDGDRGRTHFYGQIAVYTREASFAVPQRVRRAPFRTSSLVIRGVNSLVLAQGRICDENTTSICLVKTQCARRDCF